MTQPSFLWALSDPSKTSIVKRGKYIHDDIVCQDPGPEPPTSLAGQIAAALMMYPDETSISNYRVATQPCQWCHQDIDPYSRTLQNFGPIGDYRTMADGVTVDPTGTFLATSPLGAQTVDRRTGDDAGADQPARCLPDAPCRRWSATRWET